MTFNTNQCLAYNFDFLLWANKKTIKHLTELFVFLNKNKKVNTSSIGNKS